MPETVAERHFRDRMESVKRLASAPAYERAARSWQDHEDLVGLCLELSSSARDLIEKEFHLIFKHPNLTVGWLKERRRVIEELSEDYLSLAETIKSAMMQANQTGAAPNGKHLASILDRAVKCVADAKKSVLTRWLIGSPEEMAESMAAIARGETIDIAESFAEIAGTDVETWRKTVEDYKLREHGTPFDAS